MELPQVDRAVRGEGGNQQGKCRGTDPRAAGLAAGLGRRITWIVIDYMRDEADVKNGNKCVSRPFSATRPGFLFRCTGSTA